MLNHDKWINTIPKTNTKFDSKISQIDNDKWINTIPKKNTYNSVKKYSFISILFIFGLIFVSVVKNETRNLQKEINNMEASIKKIKFNLEQAILDYEVITAPANLSKLAKENLNNDFVFYKRSQIKKLDESKGSKFIGKLSKIDKVIKSNTEEKNQTTSIKSKIAKKVREKKLEIKKLQAIYSNPNTIPKEVKTQDARQIKEKKTELKNIYESPKDIITLEKAGRWTVVQVVKAFLGMPIIPGR